MGNAGKKDGRNARRRGETSRWAEAKTRRGAPSSTKKTERTFRPERSLKPLYLVILPVFSNLTKIFLYIFSSFGNFLSTVGVATVTVDASPREKTRKTASEN